jgi:hypothetical protein
MRWIRNTDGKEDSMLTFAFIAFSVVTLNILLATFANISIGDFKLGMKAMDAAAMTAYLSVSFTAYVSRRWTDKKYNQTDKSAEYERDRTNNE